MPRRRGDGGWHDNAVTYARPAQDARPGRPAISVVAHRGASEEAPEHTLAAYRRAIEDGADALECDVRLTADGHLVCVHDRRVNRTSNGRGAVSALELADLATLDFGSWKDEAAYGDEAPDRQHEDPERTSVLTLERLLELVADADRRVELAIETKHPTRWAGQVEERLVELLGRFGHTEPARGTDQTSPVRVMSFSARSLHRIRTAAPGIPVVYLMQFLSPGTATDGCRPVSVSRALVYGSSARTPITSPRRTARATRSTSGRSMTPPMSSCARNWAWTRLLQIARNRCECNWALAKAHHRVCTGAFGSYSIVFNASLRAAWPVSGPVHWGIHPVAWGKGGLGGGVGGGTRGADVVDHGRTLWSSGCGHGQATHARRAVRKWSSGQRRR